MIVELHDYIICNCPGVLHVAAKIWPCRQFLVYTRQEPCETITSRSQLANQVYYAMSLRIMTLCRSLPASSNED